jgi:hypothetical protein
MATLKPSSKWALAFRYAREYASYRPEENRIKERKNELATYLKQFAEENGVKDDKGSFYVENEQFVIGKVARKSITLDPTKTLSFLKKRGLSDCIKTVEVLDEDAITSYVESGVISIDEIRELTNTSVSYAISVNSKEEMPEVQQTEMVAQTKNPKKGIADYLR